MTDLSYLYHWQGYIPLPKSTSKPRIMSNMQVFDFALTEEELFHLDGLDEGSISSRYLSYSITLIQCLL